MTTRNEQKIAESTFMVLANAEAICEFCLAHGFTKKQTLYLSTLPLTFEDFMDVYEYAEGKKESVLKLAKHRVLQAERSRVASTLLGKIEIET